MFVFTMFQKVSAKYAWFHKASNNLCFQNVSQGVKEFCMVSQGSRMKEISIHKIQTGFQLQREALKQHRPEAPKVASIAQAVGQTVRL